MTTKRTAQDIEDWLNPLRQNFNTSPKRDKTLWPGYIPKGAVRCTLLLDRQRWYGYHVGNGYYLGYRIDNGVQHCMKTGGLKWGYRWLAAKKRGKVMAEPPKFALVAKRLRNKDGVLTRKVKIIGAFYTMEGAEKAVQTLSQRKRKVKRS